MVKRFLIDTSVLLSFYVRNRHRDDLIQLMQTGGCYFSSVTIAEFLRGAHDRHSRSVVEDFIEIVRENLLTPSSTQWLECGRVLEKLLAGKRRTKEGVLLLQNDVLIALGAKDSEATLITNDKKDFSLIEKVVTFSVEYWG